MLWKQISENKKYIQVCYYKAAYKQLYIQIHLESVDFNWVFLKELSLVCESITDESQKEAVKILLNKLSREHERNISDALIHKASLQKQEYILKD